MARQTFFSFSYKKDNWRASIVRNSYITQDRKTSGFFDSADCFSDSLDCFFDLIF